MWDEKFSVDVYVYGETPNDFLSEMTGSLKSGKALSLAEGEGRNAVHLARHGFSVTAVDSSIVGLNKAEMRAVKHGVGIETVHADLADYTIEEDSWDSIVSIFCHLPPTLREKIHGKVVSGLRKGGTFLLEAYTPEQLEHGTGGPQSIELLMKLETLAKELEGLELVHAKELTRDVREGSGHKGKAAVVQVLAKKI